MTPFAVIVASLAGYVVLLLGVGRLAARRPSNALFFTARREAAWYTVWPAMITAAMSGITLLSVPGSVAEDGFSYLQMVAGFTVGQLLVAFWLVPLFYRLRLTSLYEYLAQRFGPRSQRTGAWFFFLSKLAASALKLYIVAAALQVLLFEPLGVPFWANALLCAVIVWGYTLRGGVRSVLLTDWLKTLLILASVGVTIAALMQAMDWSLWEGWQVVRESPMSQLFFFDDPASDRYFWKMFLAGVVLLVAMTGLDQDMMQRNLSCRSVGDAQRTILLTALCQAVLIALMLVLGVLLYAYAEARDLPLPARSDHLFPMVALDEGLPRVVAVLLVAGFAAAGFSSIGASLTALTTSVSVDIMRGKSLSEKDLSRLRMGVHTALALLLFGCVLPIGYGANESAINLIYRLAGYTYGPILGLFLFGLWSRWQVRDGWVWLPAVAGPLMTLLLQVVARRLWQVEIGFELLLYNALFVMAGLWLLRCRKATA